MTYNWYLNERSSSTQARDYWEIDIENLDFSNGTTAPSFYLPIGGATTIYKEPYSCKRISEMRKSLRLEKTIRMVIRKTDRMAEMGEFGRTQSSGTMLSPAESKTIGWLPSCSCGLDPVPGVVLDPFFGAGTSGLVAKKWGRDFVGIELNPDYIKMAEERIFGPQTL